MINNGIKIYKTSVLVILLLVQLIIPNTTVAKTSIISKNDTAFDATPRMARCSISFLSHSSGTKINFSCELILSPFMNTRTRLSPS